MTPLLPYSGPATIHALVRTDNARWVEPASDWQETGLFELFFLTAHNKKSKLLPSVNIAAPELWLKMASR